MASKFWAAGTSEADSGSSSSDSDVEQQPTQDGKNATGRQKKADKPWAYDSSSSDESRKREVRSARDKALDTIRTSVNKMRTCHLISNYPELLEVFDNMLKMLSKSDSVIASHGYPPFLLRYLVELEDEVAKLYSDKEAVKKLSKARAQAFNKLRAKLAKLEFKDAVNKFREEGNLESTGSSSSDSSLSSSESESESDRGKKGKGRRASGASASSYSSSVSDALSAALDSDMDESSSSSSSSDVSDDESLGSDVGYDVRHARALIKWGKKDGGQDDAKKEKEERKKADAQKRKDVADKAKVRKGEKELEIFNEQKRESLFAEGEIVNEDSLIAKLRDISQQRMKRRAENTSRLQTLSLLVDIAREKYPNNHQLLLDMYSIMTNASLDLIQVATGPASSASWSELEGYVDKILDILLLHPNCKLAVSTIDIDSGLNPVEPNSDSTNPGTQSNSAAHPHLDGTAATLSAIASYAERVDEVLLKSLQGADMGSGDCRDKLSFTINIVTLLFKTRCVLSRSLQMKSIPESESVELCRITSRLLEHLYYTSDLFALKKWELVRRQLADSPAASILLPNLPVPETMSPSAYVYHLASKVYELAPASEVRATLRALLQTIYCHAIHDEYYAAKDLMTMTSLQELSWNSDVLDQVLYNRCLAQMGLAAFRNGKMPDAFQCLSDICGMNRQRELLAQGMSIVRGVEKPTEQERAERRRLVPGHMHINLDIIESCYNISAMLLEIPQMASHILDPKPQPKTATSRFRRLLETVEKSSTPPENAREQIMFAAMAMQKGKWKTCFNLISKLKCWQYLGSAEKKDSLLNMLSTQIREATLKTYTLTFAKYYESFSVAQLAQMLDLDKQSVHSVLSKMILNCELPALWDEIKDCVCLQNSQPTRLQLQANQILDKVSVVLDQNESILKPKQGYDSYSRRPQRTN